MGFDPDIKAEKEQYNSMRVGTRNLEHLFAAPRSLQTYVRNLVNSTMDFTKTYSQQQNINYICREVRWHLSLLRAAVLIDSRAP